MVTVLLFSTETITHIHLENREASLGAQMISRNDLSGEKGIFSVTSLYQYTSCNLKLGMQKIFAHTFAII